MMSSAIGFEIRLFFDAFLLGVILIFFYDFIRIFRRVIKHSKISEAIEDTIYWIISGFIVFVMLYHNNNGVIRWFVIAGITLGMLLYNISISKIFVKYVSIVIIKILKLLSKVINVIIKPIKFVFNGIFLQFKKLIKVLKNRSKSIKMKQKAKKQKNGVYNEKSKKRKRKKKKQKHK